ncbi:hypothetical protein M408DRAFT_148763 [Serendipita vermifera MAFF 305830]|uniref:F-box domain-containing protein n=1 Tax=Serendipita vermifera MAFF 305830 TaxID=933852 RepID=A0A0C2WRC1_SERVB|nr:hypothetical protein M408DRAFT_148763 [Serendipita vermifera MAFF 305830]
MLVQTEKSPSEGTNNYIKCLPTEILLMILEIFRPTSHRKGEYKSVLALARVCQVWREAVLNTPSFWTYIRLHLPNPPRASVIPHEFEIDIPPVFNSSYPAQLILQLERTKSAPLEIRWGVKGEPHPQLRDIIHSLAPLHRWRSLQLAFVQSGQVYIECGSGEEVYMGIEPELPGQIIGTFENLREMSLVGDGKHLSHLCNLVETTALKLETLLLGERTASLTRKELSNTCRRVSRFLAPTHT